MGKFGAGLETQAPHTERVLAELTHALAQPCATPLSSTKKLLCLCNFIRLRLFPMVYFSVCSQPAEESQGGSPCNRTIYLLSDFGAQQICCALLCSADF